jgi:mono/diheme cytochrome c family protein
MKTFPLAEVILVFLFALGVGLHLLLEPDYSKRNVEFMPDMARSPAFKAQAPNPIFPDGKTMQLPPEGTIPRGHLPLMSAGRLLDVTTRDWKKLEPAEQAAWDAVPAPWTTEDWTEGQDKASIEKGQAIYASICATCHGVDGQAGTPVTKRGVPPPPTLQDDKIRAFSDGRLFRVITVGQGNMPPHANQVTRSERWMVIRYMHQLLKSKP